MFCRYPSVCRRAPPDRTRETHRIMETGNSSGATGITLKVCAK